MAVEKSRGKQIQKMWRGNVPTPEICARFGFTRQRLHQIVAELGEAPRTIESPSRRRANRIFDKLAPQIRKAITAGVAVRQIALAIDTNYDLTRDLIRVRKLPSARSSRSYGPRITALEDLRAAYDKMNEKE